MSPLILLESMQERIEIVSHFTLATVSSEVSAHLGQSQTLYLRRLFFLYGHANLRESSGSLGWFGLLLGLFWFLSSSSASSLPFSYTLLRLRSEVPDVIWSEIIVPRSEGGCSVIGCPCVSPESAVFSFLEYSVSSTGDLKSFLYKVVSDIKVYWSRDLFYWKKSFSCLKIIQNSVIIRSNIACCIGERTRSIASLRSFSKLPSSICDAVNRSSFSE